MRQIVLDTETTGLEVSAGHRVIELAAVELVNRRPTERSLHHYLNPDREIDAGARAVHGISSDQLQGKPRFHEIAKSFIEFIAGAELIIHNAPFDVGFLDMELARAAKALGPEHGLPAGLSGISTVLDTLVIARARHPGQRNSLDALCRRYGIDASARELHGALLDARLLAGVYLAMTGGQSALALDEAAVQRDRAAGRAQGQAVRPPEALRVIRATPAEQAAHEELIALLNKASGGRCLWQSPTEPAPAIPPSTARGPT